MWVRFPPGEPVNASLAQVDRAVDSKSDGYGFDPGMMHQIGNLCCPSIKVHQLETQSSLTLKIWVSKSCLILITAGIATIVHSGTITTPNTLTQCLKHFLKKLSTVRPFIYHTPEARTLWEAKAQDNIKRYASGNN